jgi:hypothetical protein
MDTYNVIEKYYKLMKEENKFNYKYNPILSNKIKINFNLERKPFDNNIRLTKTKVLSFSESKPNQNKNEENKKEEEKQTDNTKKIFSKTINVNNTIENERTRPKKLKKIKINRIYKNKEILDENYFLNQLIENKHILWKNHGKTKGFFTKSQCPFCKKKMLEKDNNEDKLIITQNNINKDKDKDKNNILKGIKSSFLFKVNNFPLINTKVLNINKNMFFNEKEDKDKYFRTEKSWHKKISMESELSKRKKIIKIKEIQRRTIDPTNLYLIKKPLIPSVRGKILKNTKKRFEKPMRMIILEEDEYIPFEDIIINE